MVHLNPTSWQRALAAAVAVLPLAACTGGEPYTDTDPGPDEDNRVTYVTAIGTFGRDAFAWCADARGYFADQNIQVEIQPGNGTSDNLSLLLGRQAQFTLIDMVGGLIAFGQGTSGWKAVAAIHQQSVSTWMTLDPDIATVQDLEGRTIGLPSGGGIEAIWPTYVELAGADPTQITIEPVSFPDLASALVAGSVDAIGQFAYGEGGVRAAAEGRDVAVHPLSDVLTDLYGLALVTTDELIAANPERFTGALLEGLSWSLDNPQDCAQIQADATGGQNLGPEIAAGEMLAMDRYVRVAGNTPVGYFSPQRVSRMIATLESAGSIPPGITAEQIIDFNFVPSGVDQ